MIAWGWWLLFLGPNAMSRFLWSRTSMDSVESLRSMSQIQIVLNALSIVSLVLGILVVEQVTTHQDARFAKAVSPEADSEATTTEPLPVGLATF